MASYSFGASLLKSQLAGYRMAGNPGQQEHKIVLSTAIKFLHCPHHNVEKVLPHKFQKPIVIYNISDQLSDLATHPMMNLDVRDKYTSPMLETNIRHQCAFLRHTKGYTSFEVHFVHHLWIFFLLKNVLLALK